MRAEVKAHQEAKLAAIRTCLMPQPPQHPPQPWAPSACKTFVPIQKYYRDTPWKYKSLQSDNLLDLYR